MGSSDLDETAGTLSEVAATLNAAHPLGGKFPALFFFTDEGRDPDPVASIAHLPTGCGVIFRHYEAPTRSVLAQAVVTLCHAQNRLCLVAGDTALALEVKADGLHLPQHQLTGFDRGSVPEEWMVTAAAHDASALNLAERAGVDAAFISPVFQTQSHDDAHPLGVAQFTQLTANTPLPVYALGGITAKTAPRLLGQGAARSAVGIGAIGALLY